MMRLSNLPGLKRAWSRASTLLVAIMTITFVLFSNPSISTRLWFSVCSRSHYCIENGISLADVPVDKLKEFSESLEEDIYDVISLKTWIEGRMHVVGPCLRRSGSILKA